MSSNHSQRNGVATRRGVVSDLPKADLVKLNFSGLEHLLGGRVISGDSFKKHLSARVRAERVPTRKPELRDLMSYALVHNAGQLYDRAMGTVNPTEQGSIFVAYKEKEGQYVGGLLENQEGTVK